VVTNILKEPAASIFTVEVNTLRNWLSYMDMLKESGHSDPQDIREWSRMLTAVRKTALSGAQHFFLSKIGSGIVGKDDPFQGQKLFTA
jgi:hypothetical protein